MTNENIRHRTIAGPEVAPVGFKRPRIISYHARADRVAPVAESEKENLQTSGDEYSGFQPLYGDDMEKKAFNPADAGTWGFTPLPFADAKPTDLSQRAPSGFLNVDDDDASLLASPIILPSPEPIPNSDGFLKLIKENLRLTSTDDDLPTHDSKDGHGEDGHEHMTSSIYNSNEYDASGFQSPISENGNRLSLSNLEKYSKANDRLSNLRSSSGASTKPESNATELGDVLAEALTAVNEWNDELPIDRQSEKGDRISQSPEISLETALSYSLTPPCVLRPMPGLGRQRSIT